MEMLWRWVTMPPSNVVALNATEWHAFKSLKWNSLCDIHCTYALCIFNHNLFETGSPVAQVALTRYVAENGCEFLILLPLPLKWWDYRNESSCPVSVMWKSNLEICEHQVNTPPTELHPQPVFYYNLKKEIYVMHCISNVLLFSLQIWLKPYPYTYCHHYIMQHRNSEYHFFCNKNLMNR